MVSATGRPPATPHRTPGAWPARALDASSAVIRRRRPGDRTWIRVHGRAMACQFEVILPEAGAAWLGAARDVLDPPRRDRGAPQRLSRHQPHLLLNQHASRAPVPCDPELMRSCSTAPHCRRDRWRVRHHLDPAQPVLGLSAARRPAAVTRAARPRSAPSGWAKSQLEPRARHRAFPRARSRVESRRHRQGPRARPARRRSPRRRRRSGAALRREEQPAGARRPAGPSTCARHRSPTTRWRGWARDGALATSGAGEQFVDYRRPPVRTHHRSAHRLAGGRPAQRQRRHPRGRAAPTRWRPRFSSAA